MIVVGDECRLRRNTPRCEFPIFRIRDEDKALRIDVTKKLRLGLEQLFRDGALGPLQPPPSDFCLYNIGFYELNLDPAEVLPPMKPAE